MKISALVLLLFLSVQQAHAHERHVGADHNQIEGARGDIHAAVDWYTVFGVGGRIEFAIVPNGFIGGEVRDELALSFGGDILFAPTYFGWNAYSGAAYAVPVAAVQWNFYLGDHWSVFPELGVAVHVGFDGNGWRDSHGYSYGWVYPAPDVGVGARYHFGSRTALLFRISTPAGLQIGLNF